MLNNHTQEIRQCYQQATHCAQQAEAQNDPKVKKQFLELTRRWLLLAHGLTDSIAQTPPKQSDDRGED